MGVWKGNIALMDAIHAYPRECIIALRNRMIYQWGDFIEN